HTDALIIPGLDKEQPMRGHRWQVPTLVLLCASAVVLSAAEPAPPFYADKTKLLIYLDDAGREHAIDKAADWPKRRAHTPANLQLVMGPLPDNSLKLPLDIKITEEVKTATYVRRKLTFAAEKGDRVPAYLLVPTERKGKLPAVLCLHQTNGTL